MWTDEKKMEKVKLEEIAKDLFGSSARVISSPFAIKIWLPGWTEWRTVKNPDTALRAALWVWLFAVLPTMWWAEYRGLPDGIGLFGAGTIMGGIGWWLMKMLEAGFESRVKEQLTLRAAKSATENEELFTEVAIAFWAIRDTRPFLSRRHYYVPGLGRGSNDIYVTVLAPLHKALRLVKEKSLAAPGSQWTQQNYYDQAIAGACSSLGALETRWYRTVGFPLWTVRIISGASPILLFFCLIRPLLLLL